MSRFSRPVNHSRRNRHRAETIEQLAPLLGPIENEDWREEPYACLGMDPDLFFPKRKEMHQAKAVCNECHVQADCLNENLAEEHGVFGGASAVERGFLREWLKQ